MRTEFIADIYCPDDMPTLKNAENECPWACKIVKVEGGWRCFESIDDYNTWQAQK